jgi:dTDP-4-amino-4,6-dideoxygalactose transaminase
MFYQLPPVGNPVHLKGHAGSGPELPDVFSPYTPVYLDSGTSALAAAVQAAIRLKGVEAPEVILPAYGCPDLVSAVVYAGARPVLADLEPERPWMDLDQVSALINPQTVAIVAVSLFGIPERMEALRQLAAGSAAVLIEDSAQAFPHADEGDFWEGDLVVVSFGRGKPVTLLGGGAVLYRDSRFAALLPDAGRREGGQADHPLALRLQATLYNLLLSPRFYWIPQALPFLHLGETRYQPLERISPMDTARRALLPANIDGYRQDMNDTTRAAIAGVISELAGESAGIIDLPAVCGMPASRRLLRYPLLLDRKVRDAVYTRLRQMGLGASCMYAAALPDIPGLEVRLAGIGQFPVARDFAARLLTLPVFSRLRDADLMQIRACLHARQSG